MQRIEWNGANAVEVAAVGEGTTIGYDTVGAGNVAVILRGENQTFVIEGGGGEVVGLLRFAIAQIEGTPR